MNCRVLKLLLLICNIIGSHGIDSLGRSKLEKDEDVSYRTYTRANRNDYRDIRDVNFNENNVTVFIIHGFKFESPENPLQVKDDLFQYRIDVGSVIIVSWQDYSGGSGKLTGDGEAYYQVAEDHVPLLAQDLYEKIVYIRKNGSKIIELIGHSVGAHVAGQAARLLGDKLVDQIYGLDPAGRYFADRTDLALQKDDAKEVVVFHTNINGYGFRSEIGRNNIKVNGGERQPNCKLKVDECSHNEAWNSYSQYLRDNNTISQRSAKIHSYVLCLDVSKSMKDNNRLQISVLGTREIISNVLKSGTLIGIVEFNNEARVVHEIIEITGEADKKSLNSSLPNDSRGGTSIGEGLQLSMNMLKKIKAKRNDQELRSTIVLISDGEQMNGKTIAEVLEDLKNEHIAVSSIALGIDASNELEKLSSTTEGIVSYVKEDGTGQELVDIIRALSLAFERQRDTDDDDTVHLTSKELTFRSGSDLREDEMQFIIDEDNGKDTEFKLISYNVEEFNVKLTSPDGNKYSPSSSEYFYDPNTAKGYRFPEAKPGQWNFTVSKISRMKRSIELTVSGTVVAKTHQLNEIATIRLNADVSNRVLEYPKSITISAELLSGEFPVINAEVFANIKAPNQTIIRLALHDNGVFPDNLANDGIYTNDIITLPKKQRYSVIVSALSNGTAMLLPKKVDYFLKYVGNCENIPCQKLKAFEREADVGSIKLSSIENKDKIPPRKINLRGKIENEKEKLISFTWTSPNDESCIIEVKRYDIRALINGTKFENGIMFNASEVVQGSLEAENCTTNKEVNIVIKIPDQIWHYVTENVKFKLKFALKSVGLNGALSERSNIVYVATRENGGRSSSTRLHSEYYNIMSLINSAKLFSVCVLLLFVI